MASGASQRDPERGDIVGLLGYLQGPGKANEHDTAEGGQFSVGVDRAVPEGTARVGGFGRP